MNTNQVMNEVIMDNVVENIAQMNQRTERFVCKTLFVKKWFILKKSSLFEHKFCYRRMLMIVGLIVMYL